MSATERLKQFTARINRLMDEREAITGDIADVYQEVKSAGFSGPALRKVIAAMRMDEAKRNEIEAMVEMYRAAVGLARPEAVEMLESGKTIRETNRATGVALGTLHRRSKTVAKSKTEHPDPIQPSTDGSTPPPAGNDAPAPSSAALSPSVETEPDEHWEKRDGEGNFILALQVANGKVPHPADVSHAVPIRPTGTAMADLEIPAHLRVGTPENRAARGGR